MSDSVSIYGISSDLMRRWGISTASFVADTHTSLIYRVTLDDESTAIVKALKPRGAGELSGMEFLRWRQGMGAVGLMAQEGAVCLLEDAGAVTLREYRLLHGENASNRVIVDTLAQLHSDGGDTHAGLTPLRANFAALFTRAERETNEELSHVLRRAAGIADELLADQTDIRPLHGDLHHDNIISGGTRGWLAIDPQGLLGDPAYDVANVFGNPLEAFDDIINPARITALMSLFAAEIGCSEDKILRYALAHAGVSICWSLEDGTLLEDNENARERLAFFKVAISLLKP